MTYKPNHAHVKPYLILLTMLAASCIDAVAAEFTILYTGETHAALHPCDCPVEPYGGIARRATVVRQERELDPSLMLLDAGGAFAGSMFDEFTRGEERDRERTKAYLEAMRHLGYTAMAAGDEEFHYGAEFLLKQATQQPILSANAIGNGVGQERPLLAPYLLHTINEVRFAIIGLTTPEAERTSMEEVRFADPITTCRKLTEQLSTQADVLVVLSHLGEDLSRQLVNEVPGIDILINAHRKHSREASELIGKTHWLQFSYQGQKLGKFTFDFDAGQIQNTQFAQIPLDASVPDDPYVAALVRDHEETAATLSTVKLDLYVMGLCPYSVAAEAAVAEVVKLWGARLDWHLYFVLEEADGQLRSLRGPEELEEDRVQATVARYYPARVWQYLEWRHASVRGTPWQEGVEQLGLHQTRIRMALQSGQADQILREHTWRTTRLGVVDSPTIYINNQVYTGPMQPDALTRALCAKLGESKQGTPCASLPECMVDSDCQKSGFVGTCEDAGTQKARCQYREAVKIPLTVIRESDSYLANEDDILRSTRSMFPGVEVSIVDGLSVEGISLIEQFGIQRLPSYLFGSEILVAPNLERIKPSLRRIEDRYVANPASVGAPVWVGRKRVPYRIDLFIQPLSPNATQAWLSLQESLAESLWNIELHYLLEYQAAEEEAARQRVIRIYHPKRFNEYLKARLNTFESSYWEEAITEVGLDATTIKQLARDEGPTLLKADRDWAQTMQLTGEIALVVENREAVALQDAAQFRVLVQRITGQDLR